MATIATLQVNVVANTSGFASNIDKARKTLLEFSETSSMVKKTIASGFQVAGFDNKQAMQLKNQFETNAAMQDRLFNATHSSLEARLRDHDMYYDQLKYTHSGNEKLLNLITQTQMAERTKIIAENNEKASATMSVYYQKMARLALRGGIYAYAANSIINSATAMAEASRKGENMFAAFANGLPVIGTLSKSIGGLVDELSGLAEIQDVIAQKTALVDKYKSMSEGIDTQLNPKTDLEKQIEAVRQLKAEQEKLAKNTSSPLSGLLSLSPLLSIVAAIKTANYELKNPDIAPQDFDELIGKYEKFAAVQKGTSSNSAYDNLISSLREQVEYYGKTADQIEIAKAKLQGFNGAQIAEIQYLREKLSLLNAETERIKQNAMEKEKFAQSLKSLTDSLATPFEKAAEEAEKAISMLDKALSDNLLNLEDYMKYYNRVIDKYNETKGNADKSKPFVPEQGEAQSIRTAYVSLKDLNSGNQQLMELQKQTALSQTQTEYQRQLVEKQPLS